MMHNYHFGKTSQLSGLGVFLWLLLICPQLLAQDRLWGLTSAGGPQGGGTAFAINSAGTDFTVKRNFINLSGGPAAGLVQGRDGKLYGLTSGQNSSGAFYRVNPDGSDLRVLRSFSNQLSIGAGGLTLGNDGAFYVVNQIANNIFKINADGSGFTVLKSFSSQSGDYYPVGSLVQNSSGALFGVTFTTVGSSGSGSVYRINPDGSGYTVLRRFDGSVDGGSPRGSLLLASNGILYGTTSAGGGSGYGTVFRINQDGSDFQVLHRFSGGSDGAGPVSGLIQGSNGALYGTTFGIRTFSNIQNGGTIYRINPDGTGYVVLRKLGGPDGILPDGPLLEGIDGAFYGTTTRAGSTDGGTLFKINADGSGFAVVRNLNGNGQSPSPGRNLAQTSDGTLYSASGSIVYSIKPDGSSYTVLINFAANPDGANPRSSLLQASDGTFYGTTHQGGPANAGVIFKLNADGGGFSVLKSFTGSDGRGPVGKLIQGSDGALYGVTRERGNNLYGTIYKINPDGSGFTVLKHLTDAEGRNPDEGVIQGHDGALYGVASGGSGNAGTVFRLNPDGSNFTVLKNFAGGSEGISPSSGLLQASDGALYGTTLQGGIFDSNGNSFGTIYKLNPDGSGFTVLKRFFPLEGIFPRGTLIQGLDGALYGAAITGGANNGGTVFKTNTNGSNFTVLKSFTSSAEGSNPAVGLVQGSTGVLYGQTERGGSNGAGTIFRLLPNGTDFTVLRNLDETSDGANPSGRLTIQRSPASATTLRLNAGGTTYSTASGNVFSADGSFTGGSTFSVSSDIVNTADDALYQSERFGNFSYSLPLPGGSYQVTLHFAELWWGTPAAGSGGAGSRKFNVDAEGQRKLSEYDIFARAGGALRAVTESFTVSVTDGVLNLAFTNGSSDQAKVSAIEVVPATSSPGFNGYYTLIARHSGKALDIPGASLEDGVSPIQYSVNTPVSDNQSWLIEPAADGYYTIRARHSGKALDIPGASLEDGVSPIQYPVNSPVSDNQLWKIELVGDGYYKLAARHSGKVLDVAGASLEDGAQVIQYSDFAATAHNQQWQLQPVTSPARVAASGSKAAPSEAFQLKLYPNPVEDRLTVQLPFAASQVRATAVTDLTGRQYLHNAHKAGGGQQLFLPVGSLRPGLYLLRLQVGNTSRVVRFSKR